MDLERKDNGDSDADNDERDWKEVSYTDPSESELPPENRENGPYIPPEVLEGIEDAIEGRTMDGDDLDDALLF